MKHNRIFTAMLACLPLTSCYKDINMEKYRPEPKPVLNCILTPDTVIMAQVARTVFFTDHRDTDTDIDDAEVRLTVNGNFIGTMEYDETTRMYLSSYRPKAGDTVSIEAQCSLGHMNGQDIVPEAVDIEEVKLTSRTFDDPDQIIWTPNGPGYGQSYEVTYHITFTDDPSRQNFYFIRIESVDNRAAETLDYSHEEVFLAQQSSIEGATPNTEIEGKEGRAFSDELFNGARYTLTIVEKSPLFSYGDNDSRPRRIILYSLSEPYYHYLSGIFNDSEESVSGNLSSLGFAEPSPHYTNITGGTGIVGAVQSRTANTDLNSTLQ